MGKKSGVLRAARRSRQVHRQRVKRQKVSIQDYTNEPAAQQWTEDVNDEGLGEDLEKVLDRALRKSAKKQRASSAAASSQRQSVNLLEGVETLAGSNTLKEEDDDGVDDDVHARMLDSMEASAVRHRKRDRGGPAEKPGLQTAVADTADTCGDEAAQQAKGGSRSTVNRLLNLLGGPDGRGSETKAALRREMRALERRHKVLAPPAPLEQALAGRQAAYERASTETTRWAPVVARLRTAQGLHFPLERANELKIQSSEDYALRGKEHCNNVLVHMAAKMATTSADKSVDSASNPVTTLESRLYGVLFSNKVREIALAASSENTTQQEHDDILPSSLKELESRLNERRKLLARQSFLASNAKRRNKIKSKQFRRHQRRALLKNEIGELESLKETDPEAFAQRLAQLDRHRAEERISQRHRTGSKFARTQKIRAKYDQDARDAVQQMIAKNRELSDKSLRKTLMADGNEEDSEDEDDEARDRLAMQLSSELAAERGGEVSNEQVQGAATADESHRSYRVPPELRNVDQSNGAADRVQTAAMVSSGSSTAAAKRSSVLRLDYIPEVEQNDEDGMDSCANDRDALRRYFTDEPDPGDPNIVDEFDAEKSALEAEEQPKDVDVFLPGWGSWIGPGLTEKPRSLAQLSATVARAPKLHRIDTGRSRVMIREGSRGFSAAFRRHLVKRIPFPYETPEQWEAAIRRPLGREWNTESAHKELCQPRVTTRMGTIIEPIDRSHMLAGKGRRQRDIIRHHRALKEQEVTRVEEDEI